MKKILFMLLLGTSTVQAEYSESMIRVKMQGISNRIDKYNYDIEVEDYKNACFDSSILENLFADLASGLTGEARETVKEIAKKQHIETENACNL